MLWHHPAVISTLMLLFLLCSAHGAWAGPPSDQLRDGVDRAFKIIRDPALAGDKKVDERRAAIVKVAGEIFDFGEMAKRSLGSHWASEHPPSAESSFVCSPR